METLTGRIERVTFHTEDTGFSVLKVRVKGLRDPVTVTGKAASVHEGETLEATGQWVTVPEYGRQFRAESIVTRAPDSREGVERFLASGLIGGIGPVYAKRLVDAFGADVLDIIEHTSARLEEVPGVGRKRRREIKASWERWKTVREIMVFLHQHGISTGKAVRIHRAYGDDAIGVVQRNPYQLARDIHGIGFRTADAIARRLGMAQDSPFRIRAGLTHVLLDAAAAGHCALPRPELTAAAARLLELPDPAPVERSLAAGIEEAEYVCETIAGTELIFPPHLARAEKEIASRLRTLADQPASLPIRDPDRAVAWVRKVTGRDLAPAQAQAVRLALTSRVLVITGGPGVGKTTILQSIVRILEARKVRIVLAAPTGRAARRMAESTGHPAKTVHRLLEYAPGGEGFLRNERNPLAGDVFVLDEASMVDVPLLSHWLRALPPHAHVLLTGDVDQLPSVGPGSALADIIASGRVPVVRLTEIFRQAAGSRIITAAHDINAGRVPELPKPAPPGCDFHFVTRESPEEIAETIVHLARDRIPRAFGFDPVRDIQVLSPMNRGLTGTVHLNEILQRALNPPDESRPEAGRFGITFRTGDKVIQVRNSYEKDAFNGDIGRIVRIESSPQLQVEVRFEDGRTATYESGDLDELQPAWAITIHKSQGSEFPAVIIPLSTQHYVMLQRNLLYTAVTRGRRLVVLVGDNRSLQLAIRNADARKRWTALPQRLADEGRE